MQVRRAIGLAALVIGLRACSSAAAAADPEAPFEGTWYVLVHYRDADSPRPEVWRWDDRIWDLRRREDELVWTELELVTFMNVTGRFAGLRSEMARRLEGAWEPNKAQRGEIDRGLFANPRGTSVHTLAPDGAGFATRHESGRESLGLSMRRSARVSRTAAGPVFETSRTIFSPEQASQLESTRYAVIDRGRHGTLRGTYSSGSREGVFRMQPTRLRRRTLPEQTLGEERLVLKPDSLGQWENLFPSLVRPWHYWPRRLVRIESVPPGALLNVSYLRDGARRAFEETRTPVTLELPSRFMARHNDAVQLDAFSPGFRPTRELVHLHAETTSLVLELEPAANRLLEAWLRVFGDTFSLVLFTELPVDLRLLRGEDVLTVALPDTSLSDEAAALLGSVAGAGGRSLAPVQLTRDLLVRVPVERGAAGARFLRREAAGRHAALLRIPRDSRPPAGEGPPLLLDPCHEAFDTSLRSALDTAALDRALAFPDASARAFVRAVLVRLAEGQGGTLRLADGALAASDAPLEIELAMSRASLVPSLLAGLRFVLGDDASGLETLRGLVAPGTGSDVFASAFSKSAEAERRCRAETRTAGASPG